MSPTFHLKDETIAAPITPIGVGGVAIVRLSGFNSLKIAQQICALPLASCQNHRLYRCSFGKKEPIDEGLIVIMRSPHSFTGESSVEFHLHGSPLIVELIMEALLFEGAQVALPGEFTYRALVNGKLDLAQAEAIRDLINAQNQSALQIARSHLVGKFSAHITRLKDRLVKIAAQVEAAIDFPDEGLPTWNYGEIAAALDEVSISLVQLSKSYRQNSRGGEELTICLLGRPNVGKSSLLNALLQKNRAIVTAMAGTTRDVVGDVAIIAGQRVNLLDTAGIRSTSIDEIEIEGMKRTWQEVKKADLVLFVLEAPERWTRSDLEILTRLDRSKVLFIWNKIDLVKSSSSFFDSLKMPGNREESAMPISPDAEQLAISASSKRGIKELLALLQAQIEKMRPINEGEIALTSQRHWHLVNKSLANLELANCHQNERDLDLLASDLRKAIYNLQAIVGGDVSEDLLSVIFSTFCLGK